MSEKIFTRIPYPREMAEFIGAAAPWKEFCALRIDEKNLTHFPETPEGKEPGYQRRERKAGRDEKEFFHFNRNYIKTFAESGRAKIAGIRAFHDFADELLQISGDYILSIAHSMRDSIPALYENLEARELTLRFLHYIPSQDAPHILADPHFDRSGFTLHLYENYPGAQYLDWDNTWKELPIDTGKTVAFGAYQMGVLTRNKIQPLWHQVVSRPDLATLHGDRYAIVLFSSLPEVEPFPKDIRTQDLLPGYLPKVD